MRGHLRRLRLSLNRVSDGTPPNERLDNEALVLCSVAGQYRMFDTAKEEEYVLPGENCDILFLFRGSVV